MPPIIHLVRHAQGYHNLPGYDTSKTDPALTDYGVMQCARLAATFPHHDSVSLILASPLQRALRTAYASFGPSLSNTRCFHQILALPDAQETSQWACDNGSSPSDLANICKTHNWPVDLSRIHDGWNVKDPNGRYSSSSRALISRARDVRCDLRAQILQLQQRERQRGRDGEDIQIVLVTHGGFLHYLTQDWEEVTKLAGTGWTNVEYRSYVFTSGLSESDPEARIIETPESRTRRGKPAIAPTAKEQEGMFVQAMLGWEEQGMIGEESGWRELVGYIDGENATARLLDISTGAKEHEEQGRGVLLDGTGTDGTVEGLEGMSSREIKAMV